MVRNMDEECEKRHRAFGLKLLLAGAGVVVTTMLGLGGLLFNQQQACAEKLEVRIRNNEQFRATVEVKLNDIADDLREIKQAVKPQTISRSQP